MDVLFPACRSQSAGRLSDMLLKAAFGPGRAVGENPTCDGTAGTPDTQAPHAHFLRKLTAL